MLTHAKHAARKRAPCRRSSSAVSQALRALESEVVRTTDKWAYTDRNGCAYRIFPAIDKRDRERALNLTRRMYQQCGYVSSDAAPCPVSDSSTFTLLAETENGEAVGTVSLVFDSPAGLPCDEIYRDELSSLRIDGRRLVEVTQLAMSPEHRGSKLLLVHLFEFIYIYASYIKRFTDFVIEVNPRHVPFYRRLLPFEVAGPERPCPRVANAPARLLRLDLSRACKQIADVLDPNTTTSVRSLFAYFHPVAEEMEIARFLERSMRAFQNHRRSQSKASFAALRG